MYTCKSTYGSANPFMDIFSCLGDLQTDVVLLLSMSPEHFAAEVLQT